MNIPSKIVLIQLYWLSFVPLGYAVMMTMLNLGKQNKSIVFIAKTIARQNVIVKIVASFTVINLIFSIFSVLFYVFHAQPKAAPILYLTLLLFSIGYFARAIACSLTRVQDWDILRIRQETNLTKLTVLLAVLLLVFDYIFSLHVKSNSGGDAIFHMSRVLDILNNGFNVHASYMSNLRESAYHYNTFYTLYVIPSKLFHLEPMAVWEYSLSFFRIMQWLAIATFAGYVSKQWFHSKISHISYAALAVIAAVSSTSGYFFVATYPNQIVYIWMIVYIIILDYIARPSKMQALLLSLVGLIATMTHPTYALGLAGFTCMYLLVRLLVERRTLAIKEYVYFIPPIATLLIGPVISKLVPSRITDSQFHLNEPLMFHFGPVKFINPGHDMPIDLLGWVLFTTGVIATIFVLIRLRQKRHWPLAFSLVAFYPLIAYTPIFSLVNILLPTWMIQRFSTLNLLFYLYIPLAAMALLDSVVRWRALPDKARSPSVYQLALTLCVLAVSAAIVVPAYRAFNKYQYLNEAAYPYQTAIQSSFSNILTDEKVVLANQAHSYLLTGTFPIDVVAVETGHSPVGADTLARMSCQKILLNTYDYEGMKAAKVDYILFPIAPEGRSESERKIAESKPYIHLIANGPYYYVYSFNKNIANIGESSIKVDIAPCKEYFNTEK